MLSIMVTRCRPAGRIGHDRADGLSGFLDPSISAMLCHHVPETWLRNGLREHERSGVSVVAYARP